MARTSRNGGASANVDALDNIDLDDMFADDGDALFDGLDIDLDMDEIGGGGGDLDTQVKASAAGRLDVPLQAAGAPEEPATTSSRSRRKRKAKTPAFLDDTADDDFYDEPAPKKKRRKTKATTAAKKKGTKAAAKEEVAKPVTATKGKGKLKAVKQVPLVRGTSLPGSGVAAAGQFGGRQQQVKRGTSFTLPKTSRAKLPMAIKGKGRATSIPSNSAAAAAAATAASFAEIRASHPGLKQGTFCGMPPSNTLFYPFLPALPPEPTMKSRKVYQLVDRLHTTFLGLLQSPPTDSAEDVKPAKEMDPIFQLLQEAYKEEKPSSEDAAATKQAAVTRVAKVGSAIGEMRKTVTTLEVPKIAADWYAVCALLQRQHDFLKQNAENMERWCKEHMSEADYAAVYLETDPEQSKKRKAPDGPEKVSTLMSFGKNEFRVKVSCNGFKEPKGSGPLVASLPLLFLPEAKRPTKPEKSKKTKKRKVTSSSTEEAKHAAAAMSEPASKPAPPLSYANMKPTRRRKQIAEMLSRTAVELENTYFSRLDVIREAVTRQENDLRKLVTEDAVPVSHTTGMWKWLELSGFFHCPGDSGIRRLLDDVRSPEPSAIDKNSNADGGGEDDDRKMAASTQASGASDSGVDDAIFHRLQSLLVEETRDDEMKEDDDDDDSDDTDFEENYTVTETADMTKLSLDERSFLHLQCFGLTEGLSLPIHPSATPSSVVKKKDVESCPLPNGKPSPRPPWTASIFPEKMNGSVTEKFVSTDTASTPKKPESSSLVPHSGDVALSMNGGGVTSSETKQRGEASELDEVIKEMTADLVGTIELNNRRISFLETVSTSNSMSMEEQKQKNDQEASLINKCQALLKRTKEIKAKNMVKKDDSFALPW